MLQARLTPDETSTKLNEKQTCWHVFREFLRKEIFNIFVPLLKVTTEQGRPIGHRLSSFSKAVAFLFQIRCQLRMLVGLSFLERSNAVLVLRLQILKNTTEGSVNDIFCSFISRNFRSTHTHTHTHTHTTDLRASQMSLQRQLLLRFHIAEQFDKTIALATTLLKQRRYFSHVLRVN